MHITAGAALESKNILQTGKQIDLLLSEESQFLGQLMSNKLSHRREQSYFIPQLCN